MADTTLTATIDTSVVIGPRIVDGLEFLDELFAAVHVPHAVIRELAVRPDHEELEELVTLECFRETQDESRVRVSFDRLGPGEKQALAVAEQRGVDLVLVDDHAARQAATRAGLSVKGTLGILSAAADQGLLDDLADRVVQLRDAGLHLSDALVARVLGSGS